MIGSHSDRLGSRSHAAPPRNSTTDVDRTAERRHRKSRTGVVTFLFTDIEGSTRRWEADAEAMRAALSKHDQVLQTAIESHRRRVPRGHSHRMSQNAHVNRPIATNFRDSRNSSISRRRRVLLGPGRFGRMRRWLSRRCSLSRPCARAIRSFGHREHRADGLWWCSVLDTSPR
jgi:hypothetical protein